MDAGNRQEGIPVGATKDRIDRRSEMNTNLKALLILMIACALMLAGCGGDSSEGESEQPASDTTESITQTAPEVPTFDEMEFAEGTVEAELANAVREAVGYLESGDIEGLTSRFIPPDTLAKLEAEDRLPRIQQRYRMFSADMAIALREALSKKPVLNEDTTVAAYQNLEHSPNDLVLEKIDGVWYFPNK